jgi:hypothetical protein
LKLLGGMDQSYTTRCSPCQCGRPSSLQLARRTEGVYVLIYLAECEGRIACSCRIAFHASHPAPRDPTTAIGLDLPHSLAILFPLLRFLSRRFPPHYLLPALQALFNGPTAASSGSISVPLQSLPFSWPQGSKRYDALTPHDWSVFDRPMVSVDLGPALDELRALARVWRPKMPALLAPFPLPPAGLYELPLLSFVEVKQAGMAVYGRTKSRCLGLFCFSPSSGRALAGVTLGQLDVHAVMRKFAAPAAHMQIFSALDLVDYGDVMSVRFWMPVEEFEAKRARDWHAVAFRTDSWVSYMGCRSLGQAKRVQVA